MATAQEKEREQKALEKRLLAGREQIQKLIDKRQGK